MFSTLVELLSKRAMDKPDATGYLFLNDGEADRSEISYAQLDQQARAIGAEIMSRGLTSKPILLLFEPGIDYIAAFFGCLYAGSIAVPAYPPIRAKLIPRLRAIAASSGADYVLTNRSVHGIIQNQVAREMEGVIGNWIFTDDIKDSKTLADGWRRPDITGQSLAFLQYTSGSTSTPKGVMLSHDNLVANSAVIRDAFEHGPETRVVGWLPLYHDMGLIGNILQPLYNGTPLALMAPLHFLVKPYRWLKLISDFKATTSGGPNFAYELCARRLTDEQISSLDLSSWDVAFTGAEHISAATLDLFADRFRTAGFQRSAFLPCYGLAESSLMVTCEKKGAEKKESVFDKKSIEENLARLARPGQKVSETSRLVSSGYPRQGHRMLFVNPQTLIPCQAGEIGELWTSGPSVANGYWKDSEASSNTFGVRPISETADGEASPRYMRTGDLGFMFEDRAYITGRMKDLIIIRGRNFYPQDIELAVQTSHPSLRKGHGAAYSLTLDDQERLIIAQELEFRAAPDAEEVFQAVRRCISEEFEVQVHAIYLLKTGEIPMTSSGKLQRNQARALVRDNSLTVVAKWEENESGKEKSLSTPAAPSSDRPATQLPSPLQKSLWQRESQGEAIAPLGFSIDLDLGLDATRLRDSVLALIQRHENLRIGLREEAGSLSLNVAARKSPSIQVVELNKAPEGSSPANLEALSEKILQGPIGLRDRNLFQIHAIAVSSSHFRLIFTIHQAISDAPTLTRIGEDLVQIYQAYLENRTPMLD